ncbi:MAG: hypothetical protein U0930_17895 [Pirellulales bacterium]
MSGFSIQLSKLLLVVKVYWIDLMLYETPIATPLDEKTAEMLSSEAAKQFYKLLPPKDKELQSLLGRIRWLSEAMPDADLPKFEGPELSQSLKDWCVGKKSLDELKQLPAVFVVTVC